MTTTATQTQSTAFTITHARHLASKIAADLQLCQSFYGSPSQSIIPSYAEELAIMLRGGYMASYEFGFKRNGRRVLCWRYTIRNDGSVEADENAGRLFAQANLQGAAHYSFMSYSKAWWALSATERLKVKSGLPVQRTHGYLPIDGDGAWVLDRRYSANGVGAVRQSFRPRAT